MEEVTLSTQGQPGPVSEPLDSVFVSALGYRAAAVLGGLISVGVGVWWCLQLRVALREPFGFDDAYMFWRYASNIRHGLGMSWNLDGVHTYGETSLLWGAVVLGMSFLPVTAATALVAGSWVCSVLAAVGLAFAVSANAKSAFMGSVWRVLPLVAVPLVRGGIYLDNAVNGMETMLAALMVAAYVGLAVAWQRGAVRSGWLGLAGFGLFLVRPEAAIVAVLLPATMWLLMPPVAERELATVLGVLAGCLAADLICCQLYFHTAVPLSFYVKSRHGYEGYAGHWFPIGSAWAFLASCKVWLVCVVLLAGRRSWRVAVCCLLTTAVTFAYLATTLQIMGFWSRYYMPYLALFVVPGLLVLDGWIKEREESGFAWDWRWVWRGALAAALVMSFHSRRVAGAVARADEIAAGPTMVYDPPVLTTAAKAPLTINHRSAVFQGLGDLVLAPLPRGASIATTEVGYLGIAAPRMNVIDLAGLNDTRIALHGFDPAELLARKPDIIWMPHPDYTYLRGQILSDPKLLEQYDVYAGAEVFGIALRKDSPYRAQIAERMALLWAERYDGQPMEDYRVQAVSWSGRKHRQEIE